MSFFVCAECTAKGTHSRVVVAPARLIRGHRAEYYENGELHVHDAGYRITHARCEQGHSWEHRGVTPCPTCGAQVAPENSDAFGRA